MKVRSTSLPEVLLLEPQIFRDERGSFQETYNRARYVDYGISCDFVQDNVSVSEKNVIRGLHFQHPRRQDKLVHVIEGVIFDVAVDVRPGSPTFGQWTGEILSSEDRRQLFIPGYFAHGFCVLSDLAIVAYKCSQFYDPSSEKTVAWNDPAIGIEWPIANAVLSDRDRGAPRLSELEAAALPPYEGSSE